MVLVDRHRPAARSVSRIRCTARSCARALPVLRARGLRLRARRRTSRRATRCAATTRCASPGWLLDAGAEIPAALLLDAARAALLAGDPISARSSRSGRVADGAGLRAALLLARAHTVRKRFEDAEAVLAAADATASATGRRRASTTWSSASRSLFWGLDRAADARALLAARGRGRAIRRWQRRLDAAAPGARRGQLDGLRGVGRPPRRRPRRSRPRRRDPRAWPSGGSRSRCSTRADGGGGAARPAPAAPRSRSRDYHDALALGAVAADRRSSPARTGRTSRPTCAHRCATPSSVNDHEAAGHGAFSLGYTRSSAGRFATPRRWFAEADAALRAAGHVRAPAPRRARSSRASTSSTRRRRRRPRRSRPHAAALDGREPALEPASLRRARRGLGGARAWRRAAARRACSRRPRRSTRCPVYASQLAYEALRARRAGRGRSRPSRQRLARALRRALVAAYAAHARGAGGGDGDALLAVAEEMAAIGALRYAWTPPSQAAAAFVRAGRDDSARRAAARARELHVPGQGSSRRRSTGSTPRRRRSPSREAQIADARAPRADERRDRRAARALGADGRERTSTARCTSSA